jgi:hypothetical protein
VHSFAVQNPPQRVGKWKKEERNTQSYLESCCCKAAGVSGGENVGTMPLFTRGSVCCSTGENR